ncbi:unnamed protein product [Diatraea saccharalis]|uniref:Uncharacterized protein n=1 Tax=Diatraea saccharalis TaxID=40085 RepID=A0A9N9WJ81_9NEOP|nr:unnamed protein product [Diatraea saccharalis]
MVKSVFRGDICGYCNACVRSRLDAARGRDTGPVECAYKHILDAYCPGGGNTKPPESPKAACASCRWTSDAQFPESATSSSDLSLEWSSRSSHRSCMRRRKR